MRTIALSNATWALEFDKRTGALISLRWRDWTIVDRPKLSIAFEMQLPLPERRNNRARSEQQTLRSHEVAADGKTITLYWGSVASERYGEHEIAVKATVKLDEQAVIFAMQIHNQTDGAIESITFPYLGDLKRAANAEWLKGFLPVYGTALEWSLWPTYDNFLGYYGVDHPTQLSPYDAGFVPMAPFVLLRDQQQGIYMGVEQISAELVAWHGELRPGYGSSIDFRVPTEQDTPDHSVALRFGAVHVPYIQPGETRNLTPIRIEGFTGDWQAGADVYKQWRSISSLRQPQVPAWANEPHAWQMIHLNSPEDELRLSFSDLLQVAQDCAKHGVKALQIVGWTVGGQDQDNPSHDPDPRLGGFESLKQAIVAIKDLGIKVILFTKYTWADRASEAFRNDLIRLAVKDPHGDYYVHPGYRYQTPVQLLNINTKRLIPMCFSSEAYLDRCDEEFRKALDLGADGILFDEAFHHEPALLCFDPDHGHRIGAPVYANDRLLIDRFRKLSDPINPDFLFSGEALYDWEMEVYHLSYHRSESKEHIPLSRYLRPNALLMTAVTGFNDRNMVNQCLLYRYIISYEPYNFKGRLDDFPLTIAYGKQMDALRTEHRDYFWDGEFRHIVGVDVKVDGKPHHPYSVFINRRTGLTGLVIANYDEANPIIAQATPDDGSTFSRYRLVDDPTWQPVERGIAIPPQSAVVVLP
ncbi:MAG: hypothetical protein GYB68_13250 [Chloroflexi bacterium]|nr:hypothetical protein [Chloroflexota bacterium]